MNKRNPLIAAAISGLILGGSACASSKAAETSSTPAAQEKASCKAAEGGDKASCKGAEGGDKASCKGAGERLPARASEIGSPRRGARAFRGSGAASPLALQ